MTRLQSAAWALLLCLPGLAGAQTMYRCGNTFSQKPCGDNAAAVKVPGTEVTRAANASSPGALCARELGATESFQDSEILVKNTRLDGTETIRYADQTVAARRYTLFLKGHGSVTCYLSEDDQRVLRVER